MLYMTCSCGELLGNKEIIYEERMKKVCSDLKINFDLVSKGFSDHNEEYKKKRSEIVSDLCDNYCCKLALITYVDVVELIKY